MNSRARAMTLLSMIIFVPPLATPLSILTFLTTRFLSIFPYKFHERCCSYQ